MLFAATMSRGTSLKAVFKLNACDDRVANIKRLALLFDECYYLSAESHPVLLGELDEEGHIKLSNANGPQKREPFDFFTHTGPGLRYEDGSLHDPELTEALAELRDAQIAFRADADSFDELASEEYLRARNAIAGSEVMDEEFRKLSKTTPEQLEKLRITTIHAIELESGRSVVDHIVRAPNAVVDSYDITDVLTTAHRLNACPVFLDEHHRIELRHRHGRIRENIEAITKEFPRLQFSDSLRGAFGAVSFAVASEVFHLEALSSRTMTEIIKYRRAMEDARRRYVSGDLVELTALVEDNPWTAKAQTEMERYVIGKLANDLAMYHATTRETWEKMFGSLAMTLTAAARSGGAGGLLGQLLPQTSLWEMALLGTIAGLIKEAPALAKTIVESILSVRTQRRNAIAYIAEFK